jgi:hypothetical protein
VVDAAALAGVSARCLVFALGGWFLVQAAVSYDPGHAKGLDGVLTSLAQAPFGVWLLALVGLGLAAFGGLALVADRHGRRLELGRCSRPAMPGPDLRQGERADDPGFLLRGLIPDPGAAPAGYGGHGRLVHEAFGGGDRELASIDSPNHVGGPLQEL